MPPRKGSGPKRNERLIRYSIYATFLVLVVLIGYTAYLFSNGTITQNDYLVYASMAQSLIFSFVVFAYMLATGRSLKQVISQLGLSRKFFGFKYLMYGLALFLAILLLEIALGIFQALTGVQLPTNVSQLFSGLPFYFLIFSVVVVPINEEILFRGFLVPKIGAAFLSLRPAARKRTKLDYAKAMWIGIILSALIFGVLHYISYNSISELVAALAFGLLAGYVRMKKDSLYPSIIAHMLVNLLGLLLLAIVI